jgi:hypothetical protein
MKTFIVRLLVLSLLSAPSLSFSVQSCLTLLRPAQDSRPVYSLKRPQGISVEGHRYNTKDRLDLHVLNASGRVVGELVGSLYKNEYYDFFFDISEPYQRRGISQKFFEMFFRKFPKTRPVESLLVFDNLDVFINALDQGLSIREAALRTPHVRALEREGYRLSDVVYLDEEDELEVRVVLSPPQS